MGSFGFGIADKGFERLVERVQDEFDRAEIRLHMPFNDVVDPDGANHISSVIEHALAVQRPIAISRCGMFRHVLGATPSICIEDQRLGAILAQGIAPLAPFVEAWSEPSFIADTERVFDRVFRRKARPPGGAE